VTTREVSVRAHRSTFRLLLPEDSDDPVVQAYLRGERLNDYLVDLMRRLLPRHGLVLDLGCHVGTFALAAAAMGHRVIAVDASPIHVELVRRSAEANGFDELTVIHAAVSDTPGTVRFHEAGLFGTVVEEGDDALEVPADTVAGLLARAGRHVSEVGLMKMDVEGSELRALAGAAEGFASADAPPIVYESNAMTAAKFGYSIDGIRSALEVLGYRTYRRAGKAIHPCPSLEPQPEAWVDLMALKPPHVRTLGLRVAEPLDDDGLVGLFEQWAAEPHANVRAYVAREMAESWTRVGAHPRARAALGRLAADEDPEVSAAVRAATAGMPAGSAGDAPVKGPPAAPHAQQGLRARLRRPR
jgi:FkbM family methyltransferase